MSVMETNEVDIVVPVNDDGNTELIIVDQLPWAIDEGDHLVALQDKFNAYLGYVEGGQLYRDFPRAKGQRVVIRINALYAPSANGEKFLAAIRPVAKQLDIELVFDLWTRERLSPGFPLQEF